MFIEYNYEIDEKVISEEEVDIYLLSIKKKMSDKKFKKHIYSI